MNTDEIIKKYKKYLTKAQINGLIEATERTRQLHAGQRADAQAQLNQQYRSARRGLQNIGLASRQGKIISGRESALKSSLDRSYGDYNRQLRNVEQAQVEQQAVRMANQTIRARQQQEDELQKLTEQLQKAEEERRQQLKDELRGGRNGVLTETGGGADYKIAEIQALQKKISEQRKAQNAQYRGMTDTGGGADYRAIEAGYKQERNARNTLNMLRADMSNNWNRAQTDGGDFMQAVNDTYQNPVRRFFADNRQGYEAYRNLPSQQQSTINNALRQAYEDIDANAERWNRDIAAANNYNGAAQQQNIPGYEKTTTLSGSFKEDEGREDSYDTYRARNRRPVHPMSQNNPVAYAAEKARRERAAAYSTIYLISAALDKGVDIDLLLDDNFDVRYDAAIRSIESSLKDIKRQKIGDSTGTFAMLENDMLQDYANWETARMLREALSPDGVYWMTYSNANAGKYLPEGAQKVRGGSSHNALTEYYRVSGKPYMQDGWKPYTYDEEHGTERSKYAAIINDFSRMIDDPAWMYSWGKGTEFGDDLAKLNQAIGNFNFSNMGDSELQAYNKAVRTYSQTKGTMIAADANNTARKQKVETAIACAYYMTADEIDTYNSILAEQGEQKADEYFEFLLPQLADRLTYQVNRNNEAIATAALSDPVDAILTSLASVPVSLYQGATQPFKTMFAQQNDPTAAKLEAMRSNTAGRFRQAMAAQMGNVGGFIYQTGMSAVDSATVALISHGIGNLLQGAGMAANVATKAGEVIGGAILGGAAYNSAYDEAIQRGLSPEKARVTAAGQGINEMLFETLSIGTLLEKTGKSAIKTGKGAFTDYIVNMLIQAGVEGSEEVFTDIANRIWDNRINGIYSEEIQTIQRYISEGMSPDEAKKKAFWEYAGQLGLSFLGGAISGGVMAGVGQGINNIKQGGGVFGQNNPYYQSVRDAKHFDKAMRDTLDTFEFKNEKAQEIQKKGKKSNQDYALLHDTMRAELYDQYKGNVEQAVKDGVITKEDAALLQNYQEHGVQTVDENGNVVKNEDGVTKEELKTVNETLTKLDIEPLQQIVQMDQNLEFNKTVGVKNAETLREYDSNLTEAEKQYYAEVSKIKADETLTDAQKEQREVEAEQKWADAKSKASDTLAAKVGKKGEIKVEKDGYTVKTKKGSGKVTFDFSTYDGTKSENHNTVETMTEREKAALRVAQVVAAMNGTNIKVEAQFTSRTLKDGTVEDLKDKNGYYDADTDTIYVNLNGTNSVLWTISHELTHRLAQKNLTGYTELHDAIKAELTKENLTYSEVQTLEHSYQIDKLQEYLNKGMNLWDALVAYEQKRGYKGADAEEEVIARCCEQFLAKTTFINSFANKHYKTARSISAFLTRMNADMQQLFSDVNMRSTIAATTRNAEGMFETWNTDTSPEQDILNQVDALDDIARKWENAVKNVDQKRKAKERAKAESVKASTMDKSWVSSYPSTRIDYKEKSSYSPYMQHVITEYMGAVDDRLVQFAKKVVNGQYVKPVELKNVSKELGADIEKLLGWNPAGYKTIIESRIGEHIRKRHGLGGYVSGRQSDMSMADYNDFARMQFIIDNYDTIQVGKATTAYREMQPGSDNVQLKVETIVLGKRINSMYYVAEAIPNTADKTVAIMSAYIRDVDVTKKGAVPVRDTKYVPRSTSKTEAALTPKPIIHDREAEYNSKFRKNSTQDKDFHLTQRIGEQRVFEMRGTTANVYGSNVDLEGGTLLNRVRMMQNLAEMYGSVTVTATSEKEAQAFEKAGAQRENDTFGDTKYGTWAFEHQEDQYRKDTEYDAKQKRNFANAVMKEVGTYRNFSKDDMRIIRAKLEKAFAVLHNAWHGDGDQLVAWEYADRLFDQILNRYTEMTEADAEMRDSILAEMPRKTDAKGRVYREIEVTAAQMAEIRTAFESVSEYNRALSKALGTRVVVKEKENAQTLEDVFASNPYLDAETNEGDMPTVLLDRAQETVGKRTNPYKAESAERAALKEAMFEKALGLVGIEKSTTQRVREAVREARAEERAKAKDKTAKAVSEARLAERMHEGAIRAKERRGAAERETNIKREAAKREVKLKETTQQKLMKQKVDQLRRDTRTIALRWNQRLVKMLANPTEASHIPIQLAREVAEFTDALTRYLDSGTERGKLNLEKIANAYKRAFDDQETIVEAQKENPKYDPRGQVIDNEMYDDQLVDMMNELNRILQTKTLKDLNPFEMRMLLNTVRGVANTVYEANRMIGTSERKAIWQVGSTMVDQMEAAPKISRAERIYLAESLDLRRLAKIFSGSDENAEFVKLVKQLNDGAIEKERIAQALQSIFKPVTDQYGNEIRKWYGKNAEWINTGITKNGKRIEITKGMRVSLALHVLNEGNMRHIEIGGLTIPDHEMYRKGMLKDAYANGELVRLNAEQIKNIISQMTDAEKAYVRAAKELFHKRTGYYINRTSLALLGYRKAIVENYFPIHTNKNFTKTDFAELKKDGSIEGQGFLKERVEASNPVYLEDITSVVNRQIRGVALYAGLAIPMRNFNAVMNASIYEDDNGVWSPKKTVKQVLIQKMGSYGAKVVEGFLTDISEMSHVDVSPMERFAGKLATNYVKAVLLGNLKVALKQVASFPTAAAVIPWKYLRKALLAGGRNHSLISRADVDLINQYTPLYQMRKDGNANEIAYIMQKRGMEQKIPWLLGWITKMDVMTVGRLWSAAEYMVADQQKDLPVGSDAYYKAVAKVFNDTVQQTQPNYTPLQRNAALRSKNPIVRSLVLFGTQRMQNGGILLEAAYELKHSKGKSKEEIRAAKQKLGRAVASQVVQNVLLIVASLGVDALRGRMKGWQDKDKEVTVESLAKGMGDMFLSNFIGSFLVGSEIYDLISTVYKKATDSPAYGANFTVPAIDVMKYFYDTVGDLVEFINYTNESHTAEEKLKKAKTFSMDLAKAFGYATGIPLENAVKDLFKGIIPAIKDHADYFKTGEFPQWWLHQSGKLDNAKTAANYKEWTNAGKKGSVYFYWEKKLKDAESTDDESLRQVRANELHADKSLTNEEKAMLLRMVTSNATSDGAVVYGENGKIIADFTNDWRYKASFLTKRDSIAKALWRDRTASPEEKAKLLSLMADGNFDVDVAAVYTMSKNEKGELERNEIAVDFTNLDRYRASTRLSEAQYQGFLNAVDMGVPEDYASTAFIQYTVQKKQGKGANDRFHDWLFKIVSDPHQRAVLDMCVVGNAASVEGTIAYKADGKVYADYSSKELFDSFTKGKKADKADTVYGSDMSVNDKAKTFAAMYDGYTADGGIVYDKNGKVQADFTSVESYRACQLGESSYKSYKKAVGYGASEKDALDAITAYAEIKKENESDGEDDGLTGNLFREWLFDKYSDPTQRARMDAAISNKDLTVKDGKTYSEGKVYRDYKSQAWYTMSTKPKQYEYAQRLVGTGLSDERAIKLITDFKDIKKDDSELYLKGLTDAQKKLIYEYKGWKWK